MNTEHYEGCCAGQQFLFITHRDHTSPDNALVDLSENYQINEEVLSMPQVIHSKRLQSNITVLCYKSRAAGQVWDSEARGGPAYKLCPWGNIHKKPVSLSEQCGETVAAVNTTARDIWIAICAPLPLTSPCPLPLPCHLVISIITLIGETLLGWAGLGWGGEECDVINIAHCTALPLLTTSHKSWYPMKGQT